MSRVLPILFNTEMVQAILDGRKTVTRRVVKRKGYNERIHNLKNDYAYKRGDGVWEIGYKRPKRAFPQSAVGVVPPYQPGDILHVRETWRVGAWDIKNQMIAFDYKDGTLGKLTYIQDRQLFDRLVNQSREDARKAGCEYNGSDFVWEKGKSPCRWHPSIHMPKEAARIFLKVKDVRVERLQDMDCEDAMKEGINPRYCINLNHTVVKFQKLWDSTIKKSDLEQYSWSANPWVWVIEFERCEKSEDKKKIKTYECVNSFSIDKYDEDGFMTDELIHISRGEIFQCDLEDQGRIAGSWENTLKLVNENHWLEITEETLKEHFEELEGENE